MYGNINQDILLYDVKTKKIVNVKEHIIDEDVHNINLKFNKNNPVFN